MKIKRNVLGNGSERLTKENKEKNERIECQNEYIILAKELFKLLMIYFRI